VPLDPDAEKLRVLLKDMPAYETMTPEAVRKMTSEGLALLSYEGAEVASVETRDIAGVSCVVATPLGDGPFPVLVWFHGGGFVLGTAPLVTFTARDLAAGAGCVVVSVDYRLAPEHPFPAAHDDAVAVTTAVVADPAALGGRSGAVAVGGDSAGGNLAAVAALAVPGLCYQLLVYPVVDGTLSYVTDGDIADGYLLTASAMQWFADLYLQGADRKDPRASPIFATDAELARTCPAHVVVAGYDPLRNEDLAYAERLAAAGVPTEVTRYDGQMHGFFTMGGTLPTGAAALDDACAKLRLAFSSGA